MADYKKKDSEPTLDFLWDLPELAADETFSTTIRIKLTGYWPEGRPGEVLVRFYQKGEGPPSGKPVRVQKGFGTYPLTGLLPGHHYLVDAFIGDRMPVQKMIPVPELPKPKMPEQEALESERIQLERTKVYSERRKLAAQEKKPTLDEKKTVALKARLERVKAEQELKEVEKKLAWELKRASLFKPLTPKTSAKPAVSLKSEPVPVSPFRRGQEAAQRLFGKKAIH